MWTSLGIGSNGDVLTVVGGALAWAPPVTSLSNLTDVDVTGSATGALLYDAGASWADLPPDTDGLFLQTQGPGLPPQWSFALTGISNIGSGAQIVDGLLGSIANLRSIVAGSGISVTQNPDDVTVSRDPIAFDDLSNVAVAGAVVGSLLYFNGLEWVDLGIGSPGEVLAVNTGGDAFEWRPAPSGTGSVVAANVATYTVQPDEDFILVDRSATGVCVVNLPPIANHLTKRIVVKDRGRNASNFNIVIRPNGAETIDGLDEYILTQDNDSIFFVGLGSEWSTI